MLRWVSSRTAQLRGNGATAATALSSSAAVLSAATRRHATSSSASGDASSSASSSSSSSGGRTKPRSTAELLGLIAGCSVFPISVYWMTQHDACAVPTPPPVPEKEAPAFGKMQVTTVPRPQLGGPFKLVDSRSGRTVTDQDVFLGKWTLLYFGFSKCAEICPNTLTFISELISSSDALYGASGMDTKAEAEKLQAAFLSIDYIRDSPDVVEAFVNKYGKGNGRRIIGLCGNKDAVEDAARQWRVYFSSYEESEEERIAREAKGLPLPELNDTYQFDHSSAIYLVGPDGKMKDFFFREIGVPTTVERIGLHFRDAYGINQTD